jgi:hypothetical protein
MIISLSTVIFLLLFISFLQLKFNELFRNKFVYKWYSDGGGLGSVRLSMYIFIYFKKKKIINSGNVIIIVDTSSHNAIDPDKTRPVCLNDRLSVNFTIMSPKSNYIPCYDL